MHGLQQGFDDDVHNVGQQLKDIACVQVPLGSVTPLAVVQPTASSVVLLLDQKLKGQDRILVHPLTNDKTVAISSDGLEAFLR